MDEATARARLERMVAASSVPALDPADIDELMVVARRPDPLGNPSSNVAAASTWQASTAYAYGAVVTAAPAAGRWWTCAVPGVSAAGQPAWPVITSAGPTGARVADGAALVWEDAGAAWGGEWDLIAAALEGWEWKASRAVSGYDFTGDGQQFRRSQVLAHCQARAAHYRRRRAGSVSTV